MGRGLTDRRSLAFFDPLTAAFSESSVAADIALDRVRREGWPVLGTHDASALARWDAEREARAAFRSSFEDAPALARREFASGVLESWSRCVVAAPRTYSSTLSFAALTEEEFARWTHAARADATYDLHCVLGGSPVTFGIEIEFVGDPRKVAAALYELGLATEPTVSGENRPRGWTVKLDPTVEPSGGEVVSPILVDLPDCWKALDRVCAALQQVGVIVNRSCGLHVHIGADRLEDDVQSYLRLYLMNRAFEDLLYRIAAAGGDMRHRGLTYDRPLAQRGYRAFARNVGEFRRTIGATTMDAVNFMNVGTSKNTVEFRYANGTLDAQQIQALIVVFAGLIEAARRRDLALHDLAAAPLGTHVGREDSALVRRFCDTVFPTNNRAKLHVLWLYERSRWQSVPAVELAEMAKARRELLAPIFRRLALTA